MALIIVYVFLLKGLWNSMEPVPCSRWMFQLEETFLGQGHVGLSHQQKRTLLAMPYRISTLQHPLPINSKYIQGD